jgi:hypothetical protein
MFYGPQAKESLGNTVLRSDEFDYLNDLDKEVPGHPI